MKIKELTLRELIDIDIATSLICKNYENGIKQYDGTINTNSKEYASFSFYNKLHLEVIKELEERLKKII